MQLYFQRKPWDLYIAAAYSVSLAVGITLLRVGNLIALALVLFLPGYVTVAALFPRQGEMEWVERILLSAGLNIALVSIIGLTLNFMPFGISIIPVVLAIGLYSVTVCIGAYWRRMRLPENERLACALNLAFSGPLNLSRRDKALRASLIVSLIVAISSLAYAILTPEPDVAYSEFYMLGPSQSASGYPTKLNVSEPETVVIGIANHEGETINYTVRVDLVGVLIVHNASTGTNESVELNRTTWSWFNVTLVDGQNWTQAYTFHVDAAGLWKVEFVLSRDGVLSIAYREIRILFRVA